MLSVWFVASLWTLPAGAAVFARSGQKVFLPVCIDYRSDQGPLALWAFGRSWAEQTEVKDGKAEFTAPTVRVPVVYKMKSGRDEHCELVVYPDRPIAWDKDTVFVAVSASDWFKTWAKAVDMPVKYEDYLPRIDGSEPRSWPHKKHRLVILDKPYVKSAFDLGWDIALANDSNVLWLNENWFDTNVVAVLKMNLSPKLMMGPLTELQKQNWHSLPQVDHPTLCVQNRQTWIDGLSHPWVEEIRIPEKGKEHLRVVWSYLPWPRQLGRNEVADMLFIRLLTEAAQGAKDRRPLDSGWCLLYPPAKEIKAEVLLKGTKVDGIYTADPMTHPAATMYDSITYFNVVEQQLKVIDSTAVTFCMDNNIPIHVFNFKKRGNLRRILDGEKIGTLIGQAGVS